MNKLLNSSNMNVRKQVLQHVITQNNSTQNNSTQNNSTQNNFTQNNSTQNNSTQIDSTQKETICIIACHLADITRENILLHNLKYLAEIADKIIIIDSDDFINNNLKEKIKINIDFEIYYYKNNKFLCQGKWAQYLNNSDCINKYKHFILTNDSFLITRSLFDFKARIQSDNYDVVSISESYEIKYHIQDFLRCYNDKTINIILKLYNDESIKKKINDLNFYSSIVNEYEINSTYLFKNIQVIYKIPNNFKQNINFIDYMLNDYLLNKNYPILKIKKLILDKPQYLINYIKKLNLDFVI